MSLHEIKCLFQVRTISYFSFLVYQNTLFLKRCYFIINHVKNLGLAGINFLLNTQTDVSPYFKIFLQLYLINIDEL